jgi:protein gp37
MQRSKIEWTQSTWNPSVGCTKVSPGCANCYAETWSNRLKAMGVKGYERGFNLTMLHDRLQQPLKRKKSTLYFVNSMSDLFHEDASDDFILRVFDVIRETPQHTYQILTKRASRMASFFKDFDPPLNAWLGVSVEDNAFGVPRIKHLKLVNASVRFLSIEPLLEDLVLPDLKGIHWVIVGGESGSRARPMDSSWVSNVFDLCRGHNIPFFFKQWGAWGTDAVRRSKNQNGRIFLGTTWDEMPINTKWDGNGKIRLGPG